MSHPTSFLRGVGRASCLVLLALLGGALPAQNGMPKQDVIDVPAIGDGLCLHNLFQSHMVLQRDRPIRIRGWAAPGEQVTVRFAGHEATATAGDDRAFAVTLPALQASSTSRELVVSAGGAVLVLDDVLVGDVWLLSGQSNMEHPLDRVDDGALEIASANFDELRILTVPAADGPERRQSFPRLHEWSSWFGRHFRKGDWDVCRPEIARELSAIGYVFARRVHMASRVPIGVIDVSRGGTTVEAWTPREVLDGIEHVDVAAHLAAFDEKVAAWDAEADLQRRVKAHEQRVARRKQEGKPIPADWQVPTDRKPGPIADPNRPGNCFLNMVAPLAGLPVKGVIWHQGFNNALGGRNGPAFYRAVFPHMIAAWREAFGDPQLPFGIISLCTDGLPQTRDDYCEKMLNNGILIREAQYQTFLAMRAAGDENVGFCSSYDKRRSWYHPQLKVPVGERIARWALATQYGFTRLRWLPPMLQSMDVRDGSLVLTFDGNITAPDDKVAIEGFAIAGEDRHFHPATAGWLEIGRDGRNRPQYDRKALVLTSPMVAQPVHFRYAWGRNPMGNVRPQGQDDVVLATQRSDDWPSYDVPLGVLEGEEVVDGLLNRGQRGKVLQALRADDVARRVAEARAVLREYADAGEQQR